MGDEAFDEVWKEFLLVNNIRDRISNHVDVHNSLLQLLVQYVGRLQEHQGHAAVLEVGCGTAIDAYYIANHSEATVCAIDISPNAIEVARKVGEHFEKSVDLKVADIFSTQFKDSSFDLIFSQGVMEHFKDPLRALKEQARLLRNNGYLVVDVPQKYNIYTLYRKLLTALGKWPYGKERSYSLSELRKLGDSAGLSVVETFGRGTACELSKSRHAFIAVPGDICGAMTKGFSKLLGRHAVSVLQNICVVYAKAEIPQS